MLDLGISPFAFITIVTFLSGAVGTGIGGFVGVLFNTESNKVVSLLLAFAGGVMTAIVCIELLEESVEAANDIFPDSGVFLTALATLAGIAVVYLLNNVIDKRTKGKLKHLASPEHPETHDDIDELIHADFLNDARSKSQSRVSLMIAGVVMACAIALHNVPEGMTIGASFAISDDLLIGTGMAMAVLIGLHNIPEGMAVSVPLVSGGMGKVKAVLISALCGLPTLLGAWLGYWLGDLGSFGLTCSLGFASGAMLYVVFGELFPEAYLMYRSKLPGFAICAGVIVGLVALAL